MDIRLATSLDSDIFTGNNKKGFFISRQLVGVPKYGHSGDPAWKWLGGWGGGEYGMVGTCHDVLLTGVGGGEEQLRYTHTEATGQPGPFRQVRRKVQRDRVLHTPGEWKH